MVPRHLGSYLHSSLAHPVLRAWASVPNTLSPVSLMYPLFITSDANGIEAIAAMPGVFRYGVNRLKEALDPLVKEGLRSVILFGVPRDEHAVKDPTGSAAEDAQGPVILAIRLLRKLYPLLLVACDVCLCPYLAWPLCMRKQVVK
ncbi:delta-aminolevulinic acid dehydratase [Chytriomyces sp. MP71]|nr:delta-aminolevulinic acid dehydratase [Chytriomyces sp. MP71]